MSLRTNLWRVAGLALVAGVLALPLRSDASLLKGVGVRAGYWMPSAALTRDYVGTGAWSLGLDYPLGFVPQVLNGDAWTTSISVDYHYSSRKVGVHRYVPVSINQVYTFEEQNGKKPYVGFCLTAATMGATNGTGVPTVTRWGGGLIAGLKMSDKLYLEARYDMIDKHGSSWDVNGFRTYVGYRF